MSEINALLKAKQLAENGEWPEVFEIANKYFQYEEDNDFKFLEPAETEELGLLEAKSVAKAIPFWDLYGGESEDGEVIFEDENKEIIECFTDSIIDCFHVYDMSDQEKSFEKFSRVHEKATNIFNEEAYKIISMHIACMGNDFNECQNYIHALSALVAVYKEIRYTMGSITETYNIKINEFDYYKPAFELFEKLYEALYQKAVSIVEKINELSYDFPYYADEEVADMYGQAQRLLEQSICSEKDKSIKIQRSKYLINVYADALNSIYVTGGTKTYLIKDAIRDFYYGKVLELAKEIQETESDYKLPQINYEKPSESSGKKSGCYVATCVYGSYDCPQVWTLRRYRDNVLANSWYGRTFIGIYYAISPTLVKWFGSKEWFVKLWKPKLDKMVDWLQTNGTENTPYIDKKF